MKKYFLWLASSLILLLSVTACSDGANGTKQSQTYIANFETATGLTLPKGSLVEYYEQEAESDSLFRLKLRLAKTEFDSWVESLGLNSNFFPLKNSTCWGQISTAGHLKVKRT